MSHITIHTEILELQSRILRGRARLQELLHDEYRMMEIEKSNLHSEYDKHFKQLEIDVQKRALQHSELQRRAELLMMKHQRGEPLTKEIIDLIHKVVDKEYAAIRARMRELLSTNVHTSVMKPTSFTPETMTKMYKELAKTLHPDMGASKELTETYWTSVQRAYDQKDMHGLHALHTLLCSPNVVDIHEESLTNKDELVLEANKIELSIQQKETQLQQLQNQIPFCYALGLRDEHWIRNHANTLQQQIDTYVIEIQKSQDIVRMLTGSSWDIDQEVLEQNNPLMKEQSTYTEEFIDATYFSGRH